MITDDFNLTKPNRIEKKSDLQSKSPSNLTNGMTEDNKFYKKNQVNLNNLPGTYYNKITFTGIEKDINDKLIDKHKISNYAGCLLGGAIGDAMGAPLEFLDERQIKERYGENGLHYLRKRGQSYKFTDDTQMSIFTTKGLAESYLKTGRLDTEPDYDILYDSYQKWYMTQLNANNYECHPSDGIFDRKELYARRGPGYTCLTSLEKGIKGTVENPINDSPGNGAAMRSAPIGLMYHKDPQLAFKVALKAGALTHGNPNAYLPAGYMAALIANIINGKSLTESVDNSIKILKKYDNSKAFENLLRAAKYYATTEKNPVEAIKSLGEGFKGDEAVAIAVYCALKNPDNYKKAIIMAINHGGDSDTTGAITGNIMGAYLGREAIPRGWQENIELKDLLNKCAEHLYIKDSEADFMKKVSDSYKKYYYALNPDKYAAKVSSIMMDEKLTNKMNNMSLTEKLAYIKSLKENGEFSKD